MKTLDDDHAYLNHHHRICEQIVNARRQIRSPDDPRQTLDHVRRRFSEDYHVMDCRTERDHSDAAAPYGAAGVSGAVADACASRSDKKKTKRQIPVLTLTRIN